MTKQEKMFAMIRKWENSGQTKAEFARERGMSTQTFHYWFRRYADQHSESTPPRFIELPTVELTQLSGRHPSREPRLRVEFADGMSINIY